MEALHAEIKGLYGAIEHVQAVAKKMEDAEDAQKVEIRGEMMREFRENMQTQLDRFSTDMLERMNTVDRLEADMEAFKSVIGQQYDL